MLYEQAGIEGAARQCYRFVQDHTTDPYFKEEASNRLRAPGAEATNELKGAF